VIAFITASSALAKPAGKGGLRSARPDECDADALQQCARSGKRQQRIIVT